MAAADPGGVDAGDGTGGLRGALVTPQAWDSSNLDRASLAGTMSIPVFLAISLDLHLDLLPCHRLRWASHENVASLLETSQSLQAPALPGGPS